MEVRLQLHSFIYYFQLVTGSRSPCRICTFSLDNRTIQASKKPVIKLWCILMCLKSVLSSLYACGNFRRRQES